MAIGMTRQSRGSWSALALVLLCTGVAAVTGCGDGGSDSDGTDSGSGGNGSDLGADLGSTGGSGNSGLGGNGGACGGEEVSAEPVVANVLFVIDKSGSMEATPDGFTDSKWDTLVESLGAALAAVQDDIQMGLELYPSGDTEADVCAVESEVDVDVAPGTDALSEIDAALAAASPDGQTPTAGALALALEYFTEGAGSNLEGEGFVVLATDGGPNCGTTDSCVPEAGCQPDDDCGLTEAETCTVNIEDCGGAGCPGEGSYCLDASQCLDDTATLDAVTALEEAGIKTIVVGMPGSEAYQDVLDALAVAGGMPAQLTSPKYHKVEDADGLSQTLEDITEGVIRSCDILAEEPPPNPELVNVFIDGEVIPKDPDNGWQYGDSTNTFIQIVGSYCDDIESSGASSISVEYGCQTVIVK
jgi:hypothetical protein